jgi:hypothetical protein
MTKSDDFVVEMHSSCDELVRPDPEWRNPAVIDEVERGASETLSSPRRKRS